MVKGEIGRRKYPTKKIKEKIKKKITNEELIEKIKEWALDYGDPILKLRIIKEIEEVSKYSDLKYSEIKASVISIFNKNFNEQKEKLKEIKEKEKEEKKIKQFKEKEVLKKKKEEEKLNNIKKEESDVNKNTATPILPTTRYYIKSWGLYNKWEKLIIEQIDTKHFLYNFNGEKGIVEVKKYKEFDFVEQKMKTIGEGFVLNNILYLFKKKIFNARDFYNIPSLEKCQDYLEGKIKVREYKEIQKDILNVLEQTFDFSEDIDIKTSSLSIAQSWLKPLLEEFFFYGIDSTLGGGKTTLGESVYFLMRHGFLGGNISSASIPRLVDELDLNVFVDEIDQNQKDDDMMALLRKGQRRGNPYVRCEGRDNIPTAYDVAGCHGFSYRSEIEDAFMSRALRVHTSKSSSYMLPIINSSKKILLKPLADELFFWFIDKILVVGCSEEEGVAVKTKPITFIFSKKLFSREDIFKLLMKDFSKEEQDFIKQVFGRDNELTYLCLRTSKILGFDMLDDIKKIIGKKKQDEAGAEGFYLETLIGFISKPNFRLRILKDGLNTGFSFYPKNKLYAEFMGFLKDELKVSTIGTKKFSSLLRDIGFIEGLNLKSERYESYPSPCLIFDNSIMKKIGLDIKPIVEKISQDTPNNNSSIEVKENLSEEDKKLVEEFE